MKHFRIYLVKLNINFKSVISKNLTNQIIDLLINILQFLKMIKLQQIMAGF